MDPFALILGYLHEVRHRLRLLHVVRDGMLFLSVLAGLLLLLLLGAASLDYVGTIRIAGALLLVGCATLFALHLGFRLRRLGRPVALARHVGEQRRRLLSDLVSTVELGEELRLPAAPSWARGPQLRDGGSSRVVFSQPLFEALAARTWRELERERPAAFAPARRLRGVAAVVAAAAVLWAAAVTSLGGPVGDGARKLFLAAQREEGRLAPTPLVADLKLVYHYPAHMGRPPKAVASSTGHLTAPRGTLARISAVPLAPAAVAAMVVSWNRAGGAGVRPAERIALARRGGQLEGALSIVGEGSYRFELRTPERLTLLDANRHRIDLEPDAAPRAILYGPASELEVTARHHLELGYTVEDDYGVARVELCHQLAGAAAPERVVLWRAAAGERRRVAIGKYDWDLGLLELGPGARVAYWIEAFDNDTVSGPKLGRSAARVVRIYSADEKHARTLAQQQQLVDEALRILADRLLLFEKEPDLSPELRLEKSHSVHRSSATLVDGLRELRNQMRQDRLVPRATLRSVSALHRRMEGLVQGEAGLLKGLDGQRRRRQLRASSLAALRDHNRELVAEMERDVLLLANLLDEQRLQSLLALHQELQQTRKRLAELLESYRKTRDEKLRQEILRQIARMERQLSELVSRIAKLRRSIPDEYLNQEALKDLDLAASLREVGRLVREGKLDQLGSALASLDKKLRDVQSLLEGNLDQYRSRRMSERERAYSALLDQLRGLEAEQRQLAERTGRVVQRYRKRAARLLKSTINPFVRRELGKVSELRKRVNEIEPRLLGPYDQEQLERVKQRIEDLRGMLDQGDLDEGLQMARRAANGLQMLQDDLADEADSGMSPRRARLQRSLAKARAARKLATEILADLESVFPSPRALLDADDRRELAELGHKQQALRKQTGALAKELEKQRASSPFVAPEMQRGLREASELMGKAGGKLRGQLPQEAHGAQEAAAEQLSALQRQMRSARQPQELAEGSTAGPREKIEIPGADAFQPPRAFRQDILEAMKEKAPAGYRRQVKRYYEELVR
jgi:hypothetical protein